MSWQQAVLIWLAIAVVSFSVSFIAANRMNRRKQ